MTYPGAGYTELLLDEEEWYKRHGVRMEDDMAHTCPECGEIFYCNGDVDDCLFNWWNDQVQCVHCPPDCDEDDFDDDDDFP